MGRVRIDERGVVQQTSIGFTPVQLKWLKSTAKKSKVSISDIIRSLLNDHIDHMAASKKGHTNGSKKEGARA